MYYTTHFDIAICMSLSMPLGLKRWWFICILPTCSCVLLLSTNSTILCDGQQANTRLPAGGICYHALHSGFSPTCQSLNGGVGWQSSEIAGFLKWLSCKIVSASLIDLLVWQKGAKCCVKFLRFCRMVGFSKIKNWNRWRQGWCHCKKSHAWEHSLTLVPQRWSEFNPTERVTVRSGYEGCACAKSDNLRGTRSE